MEKQKIMEKQKPKYWRTKREIRLHKKYEQKLNSEEKEDD